MGIIYETGYYDGFVSGHYEDEDGKRYYAAMIQDERDAYDNQRHFGLYDLSDEEWEREDEAHADFERMVGTHCCHHLPKEERQQREEIDKGFWDKWSENPLSLAGQEPVKVISENELYGRE